MVGEVIILSIIGIMGAATIMVTGIGALVICVAMKEAIEES